MIYLVRPADLRRARRAPRAAADRRARRRLPAPERALVLAVPARRHRAVLELPRQGRRRRQLDARAAGRTAPGNGVNLLILSLLILSLSSILAAITSSSRSSTCATTGMTWMRMPLFVWSMLVYSALLLLIVPDVRRDADDAAARPGGRDALLHARRRRGALRARVLVPRPPGDLHPAAAARSGSSPRCCRCSRAGRSTAIRGLAVYSWRSAASSCSSGRIARSWSGSTATCTSC